VILRFVDRTWRVLRNTIEKGKREGAVKEVAIPLKEWAMLCGELKDLDDISRHRVRKELSLHVNGGRRADPLDAFTDKFLAYITAEGDQAVDLKYRGVRLVVQEEKEIINPVKITK
jgi:hypothetical protein